MTTPRRHWIVGIGAFVTIVGLVGAAIFLILNRTEDEPDAETVRVLLIGDSIMNQAGVYLEGSLEEQAGVDVDVRNEARNGTGLLTPATFDWVAEAPALIDEYRPDVIAVLFVGNYTDTGLWTTEGGAEVEGYSDLFFREWEAQARILQDTLASTGADIYWVNPPPMVADEGTRRVSYFRQIHRGIVQDWGGTVLIDGTDVLTDEDGEYAFELPNDDGTLEQIRTIDSVHLTARGSELLAGEIARQMVPSIRTSITVDR